ncbi:MAG: hypothetical protein ACXVCV_06215 [Polyangia bacterium]
MRRCLCLMLLSATLGCATTNSDSGPAAPSQFPTRAALEKIAASPPPAKLAADGGLAVDGWQLTGPLPDAIEPMQYSDGSPWQGLLEEVAAGHAGLTMPLSMHCVAQENGTFFLAKKALPAERLSRYIAGRCGAVAGDVQLTYLDGDFPDGATAGRFIEVSRQSIREHLQKFVKSGTQQAGIWFGHANGRAVVMVSVATRRANLETLPLVPAEDGRIVVRGEVLEPAEHLQAVFNRGRFGFGRCTLDPSVPLPRFAVTCPVDAVDASSWIEIAAFPAGRILGHVVASLLVFPSRAPSSSYSDAGYITRAVPAAADARDQLLSLLNEVRRGAGLSEVALAPRESAVAERVGPHYFAALAGVESELVADEVVLGLRAGWEVDGDLLGGEFAAGALVQTDDLGRLLDSVLERPSGRASLLDHAARLVAIGPVIAPEQHVVAMVASTYALFEGANHDADAQRVLGRLTKARIDQQMSPPRKLASVAGYAQDAAARVQRGDATTKQALKRMLESSAARLPGVAFRGFVFEVSSLEDLDFPRDLVKQPLAGVAISVTHYRPKNSPWTRLLVFILAAEPPHDGMTVARR